MWWHDYVGIPFKEKGRDISGLDCWGLVQLVFEKQRNIVLPGYEECYQTTNDRDELSAKISEEWSAKWITPQTPAEFDVIVLNMRGVPMHVGIVTKPNYMIHCAYGIGTVFERYDRMRWANKVIGFGRYDANAGK